MIQKLKSISREDAGAFLDALHDAASSATMELFCVNGDHVSAERRRSISRMLAEAIEEDINANSVSEPL